MNFQTAFAKSGRPFWYAYLQAQGGEKSFDQLIKTAASRLINEPAVAPDQWKPDINASIAIAASRLSLQFLPSSELATSLVRDHLCTCVYVSEQLDTTIAEYVSEPILALSANSLMIQSEYDFSWQEILPLLIDQIKGGYIVEKSYNGELLARILLSMAWDECCLKESSVFESIRPVSLQTFLTKLGGAKLVDEMKQGNISDANLERLLDGYVFFTHFLSVTYSVKEQDLRACFARSAAMIIKRGEMAIDLVIPVLLKDDSMSYISVQVKNYLDERRSALNLALRNGKLNEMHDSPYIAILMNLNESRDIMSECADQTTSISKVVTAAPVEQSESFQARKKLNLSGNSTSTAQSQQPSMISKTGLGALVVLNGLTDESYPFLSKKADELKKSLAEVSTCPSDPIMDGNQSEPFDSEFAFQSWFPVKHDCGGNKN